VAPGSPIPSTIRPQGLCCLAGTRRFKPSSLLLTGTLYLLLSVRSPLPHVQVNPRLHALTFCWDQDPLQIAEVHSQHQAFLQGAPIALSKVRNAAPPLSGSLPHCGCQEIYFPKAQKCPGLYTMLDHRRALVSPLKTKNTSFPSEERKAIICYSVGGTRKLASPSCSEAHHFPLHLPSGDSNLP
jgi:hypothetical protein